MTTSCVTLKHQQGFTLIELMITVAIVAVLAAIAYPSYAEYVRRGNRAEARAALTQSAQWLERAATAKGSYPLTADFPSSMTKVPSDRYAVSLTSNGTTYTLTATRQNAQAGDKCGDFTLTNTGERGIVNGSSSATIADCWNK